MDKQAIIKQLLDLSKIAESEDLEKNKQISAKISKLMANIMSWDNDMTNKEPKRFPDVSYFKSNEKLDP